MSTQQRSASGDLAFSLGAVILVIWALWTWSRLPADLVFSGDSGVKALHVRQLASGNRSTELSLAPSQPWLQELWSTGLYPLSPPFVLVRAGRPIVAFPIYFSALTAPLYRAFGGHGLRLLPLLSLFALWWAVDRASAQLGAGPWLRLFGLTVLALATPLSFYGTVFWEHLPATALAFGGLAAVLTARGVGSPARSLGAGVVAGASIWLREECAILVGAGAAAILVLGALERRAGRPARWPSRWAFAGGLALAGLLLLGANRTLYGEALGLHSHETLALLENTAKAPEAPPRFSELGMFVDFAPVTLAVPVLWLLAATLGAGSLGQRGAAIAGIVLAFLIAVPCLAPNQGGLQWGPRFLLPAYPWLVVLLVLGVSRLLARPGHLSRTVALAAVLPGFVSGLVLNTGVGATEERLYSTAFAPALAEMRRPGTPPVVAVSNQYITQELYAAIGATEFVLTRSQPAVGRLAAALLARGQTEFQFLCQPGQAVCPEPRIQGIFRRTSLPSGGSATLRYDRFRRLGPLASYRVRIDAPR